jgi:hypothetical protein
MVRVFTSLFIAKASGWMLRIPHELKPQLSDSPCGRQEDSTENSSHPLWTAIRVEL